MIKNILEVEKKIHYGSAYIYPVNEPAKKAAKLWDQKSFSPKNIRDLKDLGFIVKEVVVANGKSVEIGEM